MPSVKEVLVRKLGPHPNLTPKWGPEWNVIQAPSSSESLSGGVATSTPLSPLAPWRTWEYRGGCRQSTLRSYLESTVQPCCCPQPVSVAKSQPPSPTPSSHLSHKQKWSRDL